MPSTAWSGVQSKAIELTHLFRVAQYAKHCKAIELTRGQVLHGLGCNQRHSNSPVAWHCMDWSAIYGNHFASGSTRCQVLHDLGCNRKAIKHYMVWGAIEDNRTHPFASGISMPWGAIEGNQTHPFASDSTGSEWLGVHFITY